jgi:KDO2-lipid IV(A) lauroyltransferase
LTRIRQAAEAALVAVLLLAARVLPCRLLLGLGDWLGRLGSRFEGRRRGVTIENLRAAFGDELSDAEIRALARECWRHFGRVSMETVALRVTHENLERLVEIEGLEHVRAAYARGRGVLLFTGHLGNWELLSQVHGLLGMKMTAVARPIDNPWVDRMLNRLRSRTGIRVVHKRNAMRDMVRTLRAGEGVGLLIDQDARHQGIFVPFFGRPASTTPALALLALRTGAPVIPFSCLARGDGRYRIVYEPEVEVRASDDRDADVVRLTARCTAILEAWVRNDPARWLWMHRRWKTTPEGVTSRRA